MVKSTTIRVVLSLAVTRNWSLRQLDIQNAFLHGDLKETVYLKQPPGFTDPQKPDHVCLLHKSLYGLKQAPRAWFHRLSTALHHLGFRGSRTDPSLFIYSANGVLLYIILTENNHDAIDHVVHSLGKSFLQFKTWVPSLTFSGLRFSDMVVIYFYHKGSTLRIF